MAPAPTERPDPASHEPAGPLISPSGPALPVALEGLRLGVGWPEVQSAFPALFLEGGAQPVAGGPRVEPLGDRDRQTLVGLKVTFSRAAELERAIADWEAPAYVLRAGHCARGWLGAGGVRALVVEPRRSPSGRCPVPDAPPDLTSPELLLEEYWSVGELLPEGAQSFGFEREGSLLGLSLDEVKAALGSRLHVGSADSAGGTFAELPPINLAPSPTYVSFELGGGKVRLLRVELPAMSNDPELAPEALLARVEARWGELQPIEPHVRLVSAGEPRVEVNVLGGPVSSITLRDAPNCPSETVGEAEKAVKTLGDRWIEAREARAKPPAPGRPKTRYVNRGYRLGPKPAVLVQEQTHEPKCSENYWVLRRDKSECEPEEIEEALWGRDCCDAKCAAPPEQWMMRLYNAVQGRDEKLFERLIPESGRVRIVTRRSSRPEGEGRSFEIASGRVSRGSFDRFPDWSPHGDGVECMALQDGGTLCEAGPASYRTRFTWSGPADAMKLEEVLLETR